MDIIEKIPKTYQYNGVIHIHTKYSDGTGDVQSISKAAKHAGLDWIIITDHNNLDVKEGLINGVYVIKGEEISPEYNNHYLALGIKEVILPEENVQNYVNKVREQGGFGFAAHPDEGLITTENGEVIPRKNSYHCIPWTNKDIKPDGIEVWNWFSNWADNLDDRTLYKLAHSFLFKHSIITPPSKLTLDWWDKLNNENKNIIPAIGGCDAHALRIYKYLIPVTVFPYKTCFKTITNQITLKEPLSADFETAKNQILSAIKRGNNIIINKNRYRNALQVFISNGENAAFCGEEINLTKNSCINIKTKRKTSIKIFLNGEEIESQTGVNYIIPVLNKGKYRVVISYNKKDVAYTNPILVN